MLARAIPTETVTAVPASMNAPEAFSISIITSRWTEFSKTLIFVLSICVVLVAVHMLWFYYYVINPVGALSLLGALRYNYAPALATLSVFVLLAIAGFARTKPRLLIIDFLALSCGVCGAVFLLSGGYWRQVIAVSVLCTLFSITMIWLVNLRERTSTALRFVLVAAAAPVACVAPAGLLIGPIVLMALCGWQNGTKVRLFTSPRYFRAR